VKFRIFFSLVCLGWVVNAGLQAQSFTDSNLPIVIINTDGNTSIPDQPRVGATMKIIYSGEGVRNYISDQNNPDVLNYNGRIDIEVRGSSSQTLEKKQYGLSTLQADNVTNNNVSLLGMPKENDWVLNGLAFDASLMRDYISYTLSRRIGQYAPRTQYCEVVINGDYRGLYILQEKIKVDDNRVDILKIEPGDNTVPDISGGYIIKADKVTWEDPSAWVMATYLNSNVDFVHEFPKPSEITTAQHDYIRNEFLRLGSAAGNPSITNGFPSMIDVPSFVDFMIVNELAANVDAYQFSTFFHKDRNGKLRAGPLWDLNLTFGNDLFFWNLDRSKTNLWQFDNGDNIGAKFWKDLFTNSTFKCYLSRRWNQLTLSGAPLNKASIETLIDETVAKISEAAGREQSRWQSVGSLASNAGAIKSWLGTRMTWITSNIGSFSACANVATPPLVITRINYHPATSTAFPDSDNQEYIEIVNNSDQPVDLAGLYFSGTGFVYPFVAGTILPPQGVIQLANDRETFERDHGFAAFGEFTRKLSNSSQKLTLADAFGNVIDEVEYSDQAPWPDADGNGYSLKLIDPDLDNALGSNWVASDEPITTNIVAVEEDADKNLQVYPNPVTRTLKITSTAVLDGVQLRDAKGQQLVTAAGGSNSLTLNMEHYSKGVYLLTVVSRGKVVVKKIVKQ
jgi:hypothetical protein